METFYELAVENLRGSLETNSYEGNHMAMTGQNDIDSEAEITAETERLFFEELAEISKHKYTLDELVVIIRDLAERSDWSIKELFDYYL